MLLGQALYLFLLPFVMEVLLSKLSMSTQASIPENP